MAAAKLTIAQQKGGAGKTTLAAHLAVAFASEGRSVATVDIDPQGSLSRWHAMRVQAGRGDNPVHEQVTGWRTAQTVDRLAAHHDVVVVDSPPHMETDARLAVRSADLVLVPIQPGPLDFWAVEPTLAMIRTEGRRGLVVMNRVPARSRLTDQLAATLADMDGVTIARSRIGNRVPFAAAMMEGLGVTERSRGGAAAGEITDLAAEIAGMVGLGKS
ncbi:ParA family partition ATPase [Fodinicurvata sp. EGI_FJ10296]|uniref:ParA family partition ATPase n=1 Tax=Fodinicurvata sp. EGI_FJ10296 TaxID=3231908 RepID=UPI0034540EFE